MEASDERSILIHAQKLLPTEHAHLANIHPPQALRFPLRASGKRGSKWASSLKVIASASSGQQDTEALHKSSHATQTTS